MVDVAAVSQCRRRSPPTSPSSAQQQNPSEEAQRAQRGELKIDITVFIVKGQNESRW